MASVVFSDTQPSFQLSSVWNCHTVQLGGGNFAYQIVRGPTSSSENRTFAVSIPEGSYIKRAWISVELDSPLGGAKFRKANWAYIPPSGIAELDAYIFTPSMTEYEVTFSFQSNGIIYEDFVEHTSYQNFTNPTLNIEYIPPGETDTETDTPLDTSNTSDNDPSDGRFFLPRLLDANLVEVARLHPDTMSLELNLNPLSTARMHLPEGEPEVKIRDFVELFTPSGSVGIYRVTEIDLLRGIGGGQDLYLEHALTTLSDSLALNMQAMSGPVYTVFATLLESQNVKHWEMGDCDVPVDYEMVYEHSYDNLLKSLIKLYELLPEGYAIEANTRIRPFRLHIRAMPEDAFCECRLSRNLASARVMMEDSDLCTRVYPFGAGEGTDRISLTTLTGQQHMDAETIDTWGIVAKTFTEEDIYDALTLQDVATRYLERHKNPALSVELSAIDLYAATQEPLDRFRLGRMCRVPMPQYNTVMYERVISKTYPDVYNAPDEVTVVLANKMKTVSDEIAELMREATQSKLLGGTVETQEITSSYPDVYVENPYGQTFQISGYGNVLAVRLTYACAASGSAIKVPCRVWVDGNAVPESEDKDGTVDILRYLQKDENGVPTEGDHTIGLSPIANQGVKHYVNVRLVIKTIEKK